MAQESSLTPKKDEVVSLDRLSMNIPWWKICANQTRYLSVKNSGFGSPNPPLQETLQHQVRMGLGECTVTGMRQLLGQKRKPEEHTREQFKLSVQDTLRHQVGKGLAECTVTGRQQVFKQKRQKNVRGPSLVEDSSSYSG